MDVLEPDEFNTVGVAVGEAEAGGLQSISTHEKLRSKENVKEKVSKVEEKQVLPRCVLLSFFLLLFAETTGKSQ